MHSDSVPLTSHLQRQLSRALPLLPLVISRAYVPYRFPYPDSGFTLCHYGLETNLLRPLLSHF